MTQKFALWQIAGFVFTSIFGTLLHFLYEWSEESLITGLFSPVNESIWEHLKLIYVPMLLFSVIEYCYVGKEATHFWCLKLMGLLMALTLIPSLFYTYTGISGIMVDWLNIVIFFAASGAAYWMETNWLQKAAFCRAPQLISILLIALIGFLFVKFTLHPPHIPLFRDPVTGTYGTS